MSDTLSGRTAGTTCLRFEAVTTRNSFCLIFKERQLRLLYFLSFASTECLLLRPRSIPCTAAPLLTYGHAIAFTNLGVRFVSCLWYTLLFRQLSRADSRALAPSFWRTRFAQYFSRFPKARTSHLAQSQFPSPGSGHQLGRGSPAQTL